MSTPFPSALEELAVNFDQKVNLLETADAKAEDLANDLSEKQAALNQLQSEMSSVTILNESYKQRASEMLTSLLKDIYDMGLVTPSQLAANVINGEPIAAKANDDTTPTEETASSGDGFSKIDDEFTAARLLVSKVKSEVATLQERCDKLDGTGWVF